MTQKFKQGDAVEWNSGSGKATGKVVKRITEPTEVDGNKVEASKDNPRYLVENDNTEKVTGHKADALTSIESGGSDSSNDSSSDSDSLNEEQQSTIQDFQEAVNMTPKELEDWLETEESKSVGQKDDDGEAIGHKSGKKIIELLNSDRDDYTEDDFSHMKKVVSYVHRHSAQKPSGDIEDSRWRYSLMNWGNDPLKD